MVLESYGTHGINAHLETRRCRTHPYEISSHKLRHMFHSEGGSVFRENGIIRCAQKIPVVSYGNLWTRGVDGVVWRCRHFTQKAGGMSLVTYIVQTWSCCTYRCGGLSLLENIIMVLLTVISSVQRHNHWYWWFYQRDMLTPHIPQEPVWYE